MTARLRPLRRPRAPGWAAAPLRGAIRALAQDSSVGVWLGRGAHAAYLGEGAHARVDIAVRQSLQPSAPSAPIATTHEVDASGALASLEGVYFRTAWPRHHLRWLNHLAAGRDAIDVADVLDADHPDAVRSQTLWLPTPAALAALELLDADADTPTRVAALLACCAGELDDFVTLTDELLGALAADHAVVLIAELQWQTMMARYRRNEPSH